MKSKAILDRLIKCYRLYLDGDMKPVEGYDDKFYDGVLWAFARLTEIQPSDDDFEERTQDDLKSCEALKAYAREVICGNNPTNSLLIRMFDEIIDKAPSDPHAT